MTHRLNILSGGAAQGLISRLAPAFKSSTGLDIAGEFGAVGSMANKLRKGFAADIIVLTSALIASLADEGLIVSSSVADVGAVETALAVRSGEPKVTVRDADDLRTAFLAADAIYVPDIKASTAGIHVAKVLAQLGIADDVAPRLKIHPNGASAMRELAASGTKRSLGCTQSTEIIATKGTDLSGSLPKGCELATTYTAAVTTTAARPDAAHTLIEMLTSDSAREERNQAGFL